MEIAWIFGVLFGFIGGMGVTREVIDKKPCVIDQQTRSCMVLKEVKK